MGVISLLTDFGVQDEFVGIMHGVILRINPDARVVDLCHTIAPGDHMRAAYRLHWSYRYFPAKTIHVVVVDPGVGTSRGIVCAQVGRHLFLAPDNGVLTLVLRDTSRPIVYEVTQPSYWLSPVNPTFHGRDIFAPVAAHLARGVAPSRLGPRTTSWERLEIPEVQPLAGAGLRRRFRRHRAQKGWRGLVVDIDRFGNLVTNITRRHLEQLGSDLHRANIRVGRYRIDGIVRTYGEVARGELAAMIGSRGLLELAVREGDAALSVKARVGDSVVVEAP